MFPKSNNARGLTTEQRMKLIALIREAEERGLPIAEALRAFQRTKIRDWKTDENGWFVRSDGHVFRPYEQQLGFLKSDARFSLLISGRGGGKALSIDTPIPTIDGWTTMKDIKVGDTVFNEKGIPTKVIWISYIMLNHNCYEVKFSDESSIIADEEHLWTVLDAKARKSFGRRADKSKHPLRITRKYNRSNCRSKYDYETLTTEELSKSLFYGKRDDINYSVDCAKPLQCEEKDLPIPPYLLGAWLGDGRSASSEITVGKGSEEILDFLWQDGYYITDLKDKDQFRIDFVQDSHPRDENTGRYSRDENSFYSKLDNLNLLNNKHIPKIYLRSSYEQRFSLLQGLMDTDGCCAINGRCEFCVTREKLALDFNELIISLGYKVTMRKGIVTLNEKEFIRYRFSFVTHEPIFRMSRKLVNISKSTNQYIRTKRRYITEIKAVPSVPVRCIQVDSDSHLFLAGKSMIPTHNSATGAQKALQKIKAGYSGAVFNPSFENFKTSTWREFQAWIPWEYVVPQHKYRAEPSWEPQRPFSLSFENGAQVQCKGLKDAASARGPNINWLWYDEAQDDEDGMGWKIAIASVRVGKNPQAWATATGRGKYHWMYSFFVEQEFPEDVIELLEKIQKEANSDAPLIDWFKGTIEDNKDNLDPMFYASMLASYPVGYLREQELYGEFADPGGNLGDPKWFRDKVLKIPPENVKRRVRYWDLAASERKISGPSGKKLTDPDETVGTLLSWQEEASEDRFCIEDQVSGAMVWKDIKEKIKVTAERDGPYVPVYVEQEPGSGGINQLAALFEWLEEELPEWHFEEHNPRDQGDKIMRANIWFAEAAQGKFSMVEGKWNESFLKQLASFPSGKHDDKVDSISGARIMIAPIRRWKKIEFMHLNMKKDEENKV